MQFKTSAPITGRMLPLTSSLISNEVIMDSVVSTVSKSPAHPAQVTIRDVYSITDSARYRYICRNPKFWVPRWEIQPTTVEPITGV